MRLTTRLFAAVKSAKFLEAGAATGLTGLRTHPSPRSALIYAYCSTLERLREFPEHSVYRKSTEALTKHRLAIVESYVPAGYDEWCQRAVQYVEKNRDLFQTYGLGGTIKANGVSFLKVKEPTVLPEGEEYFVKQPEVDAAVQNSDSFQEYTALLEEKNIRVDYDPDTMDKLRLPAEPQLTAEQIGEIEDKIGAGLIEEVISVAKSELDLAHTMLENKVWEDLVERPAEAQWEYNARQTHMPKTQAPPSKQ